jgi:hypothetical protein
MGISLRHYVLSLVAIFLMLLLGLLIGVGLSSEPGLQNDIKQLNLRFGDLSRENSTLRAETETQERFAEEALPLVVRNRVPGGVIPLIVTSPSPDNASVNQLEETLELAGARTPYRLTLSDDFAAQAAAAYGGDPASACEKATGALVRAVLQSDDDALQAQRRRRLVRIKGDVPPARPTALLLIGGAEADTEGTAEVIDRPLLEALTSAGFTQVVACEATPPVSYMDVYREFGVSTVDNVDRVRGRAAVVLALAGRPGNYGDGPSARPFPELR